MDQFNSFLENVLKVEQPELPPHVVPPDDVVPENTLNKRASHDSWINTAWNYGSNDERKRSDISSLWKNAKEEGAGSSVSNQFTDKLMEKMILLMIPTDPLGEQSSNILKERMEMQKSRPPLSMNIMSNNAIQLNLRLSSTFYGIDQIINFFDWSSPAFTIGMLLVITHIILNPYLLTVVPFLLLIQNTLIPHYLTIYPPDSTLVPDYLDFNPEPSAEQIEKYKVPKPIPQFSSEFILNLTDLQNHQVLYVTMYDFAVWLTNDYLYFKDEITSSIVYLTLLIMMVSNLLFGPTMFSYFFERVYLVKFGCIFWVWTISIMFYPSFRTRILEWAYNEETRLNFQLFSNRIENTLLKHLDKEPVAPELKEVEIFELQKLDKKSRIWSLVGFTNNFYTFNISSRKHNIEEAQKVVVEVETEDNESIGSQRSYIKLAKKRSMIDVQPPSNWVFHDKKWTLDLNVNEWVDENLINDLVLIDEDEKWVYDYQEEDVPKESLKEVYRRRRWIRNCKRETYKERNE